MFYENSQGYVKHVAGGIDSFCCITDGASCSNDFMTSITLNSEVGNPDPNNYALGDTIVFELSGGKLCKIDKNGMCINNGDEVTLPLPDYKYEYVLIAADFDCD